MNKVTIITLGCAKNTVDSERLANQLKLNNFEFTDDAEKADTVIINTCGFIDAAKEESVDTILQAIEMKKSGKIKKVIVSGCLSQRYREELLDEIPEVDNFFGTEDYNGIITSLGGTLRTELLGERLLSSPSHSAFLKISEGCDNPCSFCSIPLIRGKHKSRTIESLMQEAEFLAGLGVKELNVIAQDTTYYGLDIYGKREIASLLQNLSNINGIEWIRLLYAYPSHFPYELIDVMSQNKKICKYIDIPLQHISDNILKSMRRGITSRQTRKLIEDLRAAIPGIAIRTTFIVGYPEETEKEFEELCEFIGEYQFDRVGVFTYSTEENTIAYNLEDKVPQEVKEERKARLMEIQQEISNTINQAKIGSIVSVIIDRKEGEFFIGRTSQDAPEVDCEVIIDPKGEKISAGEFRDVIIKEAYEYDLTAEICRG